MTSSLMVSSSLILRTRAICGKSRSRKSEVAARDASDGRNSLVIREVVWVEIVAEAFHCRPRTKHEFLGGEGLVVVCEAEAAEELR